MTESTPSPVHLHTLGPLTVTMGDADAKAPLLTQPRRLAVLAYLVLARPRALHSRDTIVSLLWPEADQASGRHALRNALHGIRHALGDVIVNAGDEQVGVNRDRISCDAIDLEADIAAGRLSEGLARYSGELLQGFHVADAPQFEHWLDGERSRLHDLAFRAAVSVSDASRARGDADGALSAARRASALAPDDETSLRRLMEILSAAGDKRGALREYERFAVRAIEEYGAEPGAETLKLARSLRATASKPQASPSAKKVVVSASDSPLSDPNASAINTKVVDAMPPVDTTVARGRRLVVGGITTLAVVVLLAIGWRGGPLAQATTARSLGAARGIASIGAVARLPERYRADTALLRRYLVAEADLQFSRLAPARESFQRLVDENPLYAPAWAGLGFALFSSGFEEMAPSDAMPRAVAAANHALAMDSTLVEAQSTLIANAMFWRWDLPEAKRRIDAALAMHPNDPELQNLLATWYRWRGDVEAAVRLKARTLAIDPLSPRYTKQVGSSLYFAHRCKEAAEIFRRIAEERRRNSYVGLTLYRSLKCLGKMDEATVAMRQYLVETGDTTLAHLLDPPLPPARRDSAISTVFRAKLDRRFEQRRRTWKTSTEAMLDYAEMQNRDSTLAWLDSMYVERAFMLHVVPFDPTMDFLRGDPRFEEFLRRLPWKPEAVILADPTSRR